MGERKVNKKDKTFESLNVCKSKNHALQRKPNLRRQFTA